MKQKRYEEELGGLEFFKELEELGYKLSKVKILEEISKTLEEEFVSYKSKLKEAEDVYAEEQNENYTKISGIIMGIYLSMSIVNKYRRIDDEIKNKLEEEMKRLKSEIRISELGDDFT